jgi:MGT family glycosyltransferase
VAGVPWADQSVGILRPLGMFRLAANVLRPLWEQWGVDLGSRAGMFRYLYLDVCPPSLQSPEIDSLEVAHPVKNVAIEPVADERLPDWVLDLPPMPTVYVSLGTIFNQNLDVFGVILAGLRDEPLNVIVTVGHDNDPSAFGPQPPNVRLERFIPQAALLPHCDLVLCHGGSGTLLGALDHGLPLVVVPLRADQPENARAAAAAGAAVVVAPEAATPESVRGAVRAALGEPGYRAGARRVQAELHALPPMAQAVRLLEGLAAG